MAEGVSETDPLMGHTDDRNDGDGDHTNATRPFQPRAASTHTPGEQISSRTTTMNRPSERGPQTAETSFIEGNLINQFKLDEAQKKIKYYYPDYDGSLDLTISEKGRIEAKGPKRGPVEVLKQTENHVLPILKK